MRYNETNSACTHLDETTITITANFALYEKEADVQISGSPAALYSYLFPAMVRLIRMARNLEGAAEIMDIIHLTLTFDLDNENLEITNAPDFVADIIRTEAHRIVGRTREKSYEPLY